MTKIHSGMTTNCNKLQLAKFPGGFVFYIYMMGIQSRAAKAEVSGYLSSLTLLTVTTN
jgi:hypothetical protein